MERIREVSDFYSCQKLSIGANDALGNNSGGYCFPISKIGPSLNLRGFFLLLKNAGHQGAPLKAILFGATSVHLGQQQSPAGFPFVATNSRLKTSRLKRRGEDEIGSTSC
jgi:hypothetical protein